MRGLERLVLLSVWAILGLLSASSSPAEKAEIRGAAQFEVPGWFKRSFLDLNEDVADAAKQGKRLLLYFGQDGCPYCAELFNINFSQPHIRDYTRRHYDA